MVRKVRTKAETSSRKRPVKKKKGLSLEWKFLIAALLLILLSPFYYGYVIRVFTSGWRWLKDIGEDTAYRTYHSFDIRIPRGYGIHGIDVSSYQGKIDWKEVRQMEDDDVRVHFAFIKATEGMFNVDPYFQRNWREAPKAGIVCGAYHYFKPKKSGEWQARFFLQTVKFESGDLPPVIDIEELNGVSPAKMRLELQKFLSHIEKSTSIKPIIYTGLSFYNDYLKGHFDDYPLWIAHYYKARLDIDRSRWKFWQHSDKARISGIHHAVDFNAFNGDSIAFDRLLIR